MSATLPLPLLPVAPLRPCACGDCPACDDRLAFDRAHDLGLDADEVRLHADIAASGDLSLGDLSLAVALDDELDPETLVLDAERRGFEGDDLPDVAGLPASWVAAVCRAWLDGRDERRGAHATLEERYAERTW